MIVRVFTTYPIADASRRLRIEPIVRELREQGVTVRVHELFTGFVFRNKNAGLLLKAVAGIILCARLFQRLVLIVFTRADIAIVHREAMPFFTPVFERLVAERARVSVLDVDDAIYTSPTHSKDWRSFLRKPERALDYSSIFDVILCGNQQLMEVFGGGTAQVAYSPTCPPEYVWNIDGNQDLSNGVVLAWTGSQSTLGSLQEVLNETLIVCEEMGARLRVLGGDNVTELPEHPNLTATRWTAEAESDLLQSAQIGLMPLPTTEWESGKSGFKAILFLCSGMRVVASPVGINAQLISDYGAVLDGTVWSETLRVAIRETQRAEPEKVSRAKARETFDSLENARNTVALLLAGAQS